MTKSIKNLQTKLKKLVDVVMREADNFGMGEMAMEFEGKYHVDDEYAEEKYWRLLEDKGMDVVEVFGGEEIRK